jgi:hypothetical protein
MRRVVTDPAQGDGQVPLPDRASRNAPYPAQLADVADQPAGVPVLPGKQGRTGRRTDRNRRVVVRELKAAVLDQALDMRHRAVLLAMRTDEVRVEHPHGLVVGLDDHQVGTGPGKPDRMAERSG